MPHAVFDPLTSQTSDARGGARPLIPGIEPGGQRAGRDTKPALLITDYAVEILAAVPTDDVGNWARIGLILSQDQDLNPGLIIRMATLGCTTSDMTTGGAGGLVLEPVNGHKGTLWAPAYVGWMVQLINWSGGVRPRLHLWYEEVEIPWMDWFIMWEFLDGVTDESEEY